MKRINILPNIITAFGLSCGLFVIFKVNMTGSSTYELLHQMTLILLLAGIADLLDGAVARAIHAESEFGLIFDSLADAISFGVAPSVLLLKALGLPQGSPLSFYAMAASMLYTLCGVLRLVRYNIKSSQAKTVKLVKQEEGFAKNSFLGLPIPAAAVAAIAPNLLVNSPLFEQWIELSDTFKAVLLPTIMIVIAYLMVSKLRYPSLKAIHFRLPSFQLIFFTTLSAILILYGLLYFLPVLLTVLVTGYILLGIALSIARMVIGKRSSKLKDFDTNDEED